MSGYNDSSNCKSWKVLETVSNHLKREKLLLNISQNIGITNGTMSQLQVRGLAVTQS